MRAGDPIKLVSLNAPAAEPGRRAATNTMAIPLQFTGERFVPGTEGEIAHEHWHRYAFARGLVAGKRVLDVACGEGYGSALLCEVAQSVVGIDIDRTTIAHATQTYPGSENLRFAEGS